MGQRGSSKSVFKRGIMYFGHGARPFEDITGVGKVDGPPGIDIDIVFDPPPWGGLFGEDGWEGVEWVPPPPPEDE